MVCGAARIGWTKPSSVRDLALCNASPVVLSSTRLPKWLFAARTDLGWRPRLDRSGLQRSKVKKSNRSGSLACTSRIASLRDLQRSQPDRGSPAARVPANGHLVAHCATLCSAEGCPPLAARRSAALRVQRQATNFLSGIGDCPDTSRFLLAVARFRVLYLWLAAGARESFDPLPAPP
jgi:hypothetical protein